MKRGLKKDSTVKFKSEPEAFTPDADSSSTAVEQEKAAAAAKKPTAPKKRGGINKHKQ